MEVTLLGFGEAGQAFATGWRDAGLAIDLRSYDRKLEDEAQDDLHEAAARAQVGLVAHARAFAGIQHVVSVVTADQALKAAQDAAPYLSPGQIYWDLNSVAPATKRSAADAVTASGALYVDVGVLSPVHPKRHHAPLAIAGPRTPEVAAAVDALDLRAQHLSDRIGDAAALKLLRSVVIKGIEGALVECVAAGRVAGLTEPVLASLAPSFPGIDWPARAAYVCDRVRQHGPRRAAEMQEAAAFLSEIGI
ncbi:MAG: DUF1932 domain-containing protein, partial [Pseudomonadota bacterium]